MGAEHIPQGSYTRLELQVKILEADLKIMENTALRSDAKDQAHIDQLEAENKGLRQTIKQHKETLQKLMQYKRPNGHIAGLFSRPLAPLPANLPDTKIDADARATMKSLPSYWMAAIGTLACILGVLITLSMYAPWIFISPLSLFLDGMSVSEEAQGAVGFVIACILSVIALFVLIRARKSVYNFAHEEEKWFRAGCENWTLRQRIVSCLMFGMCHIVNIIYPVITCVLLSIGGAMFMAAYLREYRRSKDSHRALLASTKMHARYNFCAFSLILAFVCLGLVVSIL